MVKMIGKLLFLLLFGWIIQSFGVDLSRAVIVLPDQANEVEKFAGKELQDNLKLITGREFEVIKERDYTGDSPAAIFVGNTVAAAKNGIDVAMMARHEFIVKSAPGKLFLVGKDGGTTGWDGFSRATLPMNDNISQGTLLATRDFLDRECGVLYLWPGADGVFAPKNSKLQCPDDLSRPGKLRLAHIRFRYFTAPDAFSRAAGLSDEMFEKLRQETFLQLNRHGMLRDIRLEYGHAFSKYWSRFGEDHPEFFALNGDGKRKPFDQRTELVQMCVSNPDFRKQVIDDYRTLRKQQPDKTFINAAENDQRLQDSSCTCSACKAWDSKSSSSGSLSDRYAKFYLALQQEAAKYEDHPQVLGYAYSTYSDAPLETQLNSDILIGLVSSFFYPGAQTKNGSIRELYSRWRKTGAAIYFRPNCYLHGYSLPYIHARESGADLDYFLRNDLRGIDVDSLTAMWGVQGLNYYMLMRQLRRDDLSVEDICNEYYRAFGLAEPKIKQYFEFFEAITRERNQDFEQKHPQGGYNKMGWFGNEIFTAERLQKGKNILDEAEKLAQNDSDASAKVRFLQTGLQHAILTVDVMDAFQRANRKRGNAEFQAKLQQLDDFRKTITGLHVVNLPLLYKLEMWSGWRTKPVDK